MNEIFETTEYDKFSYIEGNRKVRPGHVAALTISILNRNMLKQNPVIVSKDLQIIDGQHRLEVARNNNLPIYYTIVGDADINEVMQLNAYVKPWSLTDYLDGWAIRGHESYLWLKEFKTEHGFSVKTCLVLLFGYESTSAATRFKQGKLQLTDEQRKTAERRANLLEEVKPFLINRSGISEVVQRSIVTIDLAGLGKQFIAAVKAEGKAFRPQETYMGQLRFFYELMGKEDELAKM